MVAITGASGVIYGIRALQILHDTGAESHLVLSDAAKVTIRQETDWKVSDVAALADHSYKANDIGAAIASGSFTVDGMIIAPCSIKTLSAIANSYANDLISRAADVQLKEGRPLLLMVRETPLHRGHLRLMDLAAAAGAVIFPPVPAFYGKPASIEALIDATVGRALLRLGLDNEAYTRWQGL
ncbi:MAG: UbiX family flavin prenyltransferase [Anaerolineales bacterium]